MKSFLLPLAVTFLAAICLLFTGCGGEAGPKLDTAEVESAFANAEAPIKGQVDAAAKLLNSGKLVDGTSALARMARESHEQLSEEQKTALVNLVTTIQLIMSADGNKGDLKLYQAADDLMAGMDGREAPRVGINPDAVRPPQSTEE